MVRGDSSVVVRSNLGFLLVMSQLHISSVLLVLFIEVDPTTAQSADTQTQAQDQDRQNQGCCDHAPNYGSNQYDIDIITCGMSR